VSISEQQRQENQDRHLGERDPKRPPGLSLVIIAFILLAALGYAIHPTGVSQAPTPETSGGGPSAMTNPAQSPTGK
jgi:hypothetical protein